MCSGPMIILKVTFQDSTQMPFIDNDQVVQTFASDTSDHTLRVAVLPRTSCRYWNLVDVQSLYSDNEMVSIDSVAIPHEVMWCRVLRKGFDDLLRSPHSRGVFGDIEVHNSASVVRENNKGIQHLQLNRRHSKEIDRYYLPH